MNKTYIKWHYPKNGDLPDRYKRCVCLVKDGRGYLFLGEHVSGTFFFDEDQLAPAHMDELDAWIDANELDEFLSRGSKNEKE